MENLLEAARIAWNPIGEVRRRLTEGTLTFSSVLVPFVGIAIACNLIAFAGQRFFWESAISAAGGQLPDNPLMKDFAQRFLATLNVLVPAGALWLLPARIFSPFGRSASAACITVVGAAWAFYGAAISLPISFVSGLLASSDPQLGLKVFLTLGLITGILLLGLILFFWLRITVSILRFRGPQVLEISAVATFCTLVVAGLILWIVSVSTATAT